MRTLKKTLCMVLVLAMMVGLCAMGASAINFDDYTDKDEITQVEAVQVLTGMGVLQGDETGAFHPTATLTRAEGATFATKLRATSGSGVSSFTDMTNYDWAQPAVAYCEQNNIIAGVGGGLFAPAEPLTEVAWAKMMLVALGYDPEIEGLVGNQWEINTIKLVNEIGLADGINTLNWDGPIIREDAARFAYNTLKTPMVEYYGGTHVSVKTGDGTDVKVDSDSMWHELGNESYDYRGFDYYGDPYDDYMQYVENFFPNVKLTIRSDDFGYPTKNWFIGNGRNDNNWQLAKQIAVAPTGEAMAIYTTPATTTVGTVYADSGWNTEGGYLEVWENGDNYYTVAHDIEMYATGAAAQKRLSQYAGATATLIDDLGDGKADRLVVKYAYPATVTAVKEANKSDSGKRELTLTVYNGKDGGSVKATFASEEFSKGDVVLVYPLGTIEDTSAATELNIKEIAKPESVKGTLSKWAAGAPGQKASLTVDGVAYSVGAKSLANMGLSGKDVHLSDIAVGQTYTLYLSNGAAVGIAGDPPSYASYVFAVNAIYKTGSDATLPTGGASTWSVGVAKQDGSTEALVATTETKNVWATYRTVNGITTFYPVPDTLDTTKLAYQVERTMNAASKIQKDKPTIADGITADSSTVFIFYTSTGYKTYTGLANIPNYELAHETTAYALVSSSTKIAKAVFINLVNEEPKSDTTGTVYILSSSVATVEADSTVVGGKVYAYAAVVDGKFDYVKTADPDLVTATGLFTPSVATNGYVNKLTPVDVSGTKTAQKITITGDTKSIGFSGGTLTIDGNSFATNDSTQVFYYEFAFSKNNIEAGSAAELAGLKNVTVTAVWSATSNVLKAVYVIPAVA